MNIVLEHCSHAFPLHQRWLTIAIASGQVPDVIIDAHHIIEYLKYTGTRKYSAKVAMSEMTGPCLR
jgi:hypothetical protein